MLKCTLLDPFSFSTKLCSTPEMATASQQINKRDVKMESSGTNKSYDVKLENIDVSYGDKYVNPRSFPFCQKCQSSRISRYRLKFKF